MTKKEKQIAINNDIEYWIDKFYNPDYETFKTKWERLDYCQAETAETDNYVWLCSYSTIIAVIDKETGVLYDVLRKVYGYTATSAKHIAKFRHKFREYIVAEMTWRTV